MRGLGALLRGTALLALLTLGACAPGDREPPTGDSAVGPVPRPDAAWEEQGAEAFGGVGAVKELGDEFIAATLDFFPSRATAAGWYANDSRLESFDAVSVAGHLATAEDVLQRLDGALAEDCARLSDAGCAAARVDAELLRREIELFLLGWREGDAPRQEPGLWSGTVGRSSVYLLVREDRPREERVGHIVDRLRQVPGFLQTAREMLAEGDPSRTSPMEVRLAVGQARSTASFHRDGLLDAARADGEPLSADLAGSLAEAGRASAEALESFADWLAPLEGRVSGSPVLGPELYARRFALYTGLDDSPSEVLADAEAALAEILDEADRHALAIWDDVFDEPPPDTARERVRRLFLRLGDDHAASIDEFVRDYRDLVQAATDFVRDHEVVSVAEPLTLVTDRSPSYFSGAAVGGVYSAGPYAPQADTILYLPTPPPSFDAEQQDAFFRDFNHHFNVMITPHELMPGHYLQLKWAALHPSRIRALFGDGVTIEGWGTFAERLMLDLGWGDELAYAAHLKKRMENTARTIVDIRVHTMGMGEEEVERYVVEEALQEAQFARNMRRRTLTTSPQLVSYWLGSREIERVYGEWRRLHPDAPVRAFTDGVMTMGPVPLDRLVELLEGG